MVDGKHERLRELFDRALTLPREQRDAFLDSACADDMPLRRRLNAMLSAADSERFLSAPSSPSASGATRSLEEASGVVIGPYKLLEQIGEGGFGTVWMAEQREPVKRRVALKILKPGMDSQQVVARFDQERQALALMDHPNIARVLDAGATERGRPYFVMELVRGVPVLEYCDSNRLDTRARLALFVDICRAIQHAHQKGIIHRDIKPSNVLVALHDGVAVPKVIDFGIAKATNAEITTRTLFTEHRQIIGTPAYMSPEQAENSGLDIDTRSDVYSLGVLLYELLTGTTPFDVRELLQVGLEEMLRTIREVEPHKPSTRISSLGETAERTAERRSLDVKRLNTLLRGDLDWIVMRCLEKDRARRYETASSLALDIQRHLAGETVLAAPPSAAYRLRKSIRRNRGAYAAASLVLLALITGLFGTLWQARVAARERDKALAAEGVARSRATELAQVADFQATLLAGVDSSDAGQRLVKDLRQRYDEAIAAGSADEADRATRAQAFTNALGRVNATDVASRFVDETLLSPALVAIQARFADQPLVDARLRQTLAVAYIGLGRAQEGLPLVELAYQTRLRLLGPDHADTLQSLNDKARALELVGRDREAEAIYGEALAGRRALLGSDDRETMITLGNLGNNLRGQGRHDEAEPLLRESYETLRRVRGPDDRDTLIAMNSLGLLHAMRGRYDEAEPLWRETYERGKRVLGIDRDTIVWINNLGGLISSRGRAKEAEPYYREAYAAAQRLHGEEHPATAQCLYNIAVCLGHQGRFAESEAMTREVLATRRRILGDDHVDTILTLRSIGNELRRQGRLSDAEGPLREAYESFRRIFGADHTESLVSASMLTSFLQANGQLDDAESLMRDTLARMRATLGDEHHDTLIQANNLGGLLLARGRPAEAEPMLRTAFEARQRVSGADHPETLIVQSTLARVLEDQDKLAEAEALFQDASERFLRVLGPEHPNSNSSLANLGGVISAQGRHEESLDFYRRAIAGFQKSLGPDHSRVAGAQSGLGRSLKKLGRFEAARDALLDANRIYSSAPGTSAERLRQSRESLAELYEAWDRAQPNQGHAAQALKWRAD